MESTSDDDPLLSEEIDVNNAIRTIKEFIHPSYSGVTGKIVRKFIGKSAVNKIIRIYEALCKFQKKNPNDKFLTAYLYK